MDKEDLKLLTKSFSLAVIHLVNSLNGDKVFHVLGGQLLRSGTSVGANYRAACRAKSRADFISKMGIVEEEMDESLYWLELFVESGYLKLEKVQDLMGKGKEILAIVVSSIRTVRERS